MPFGLGWVNLYKVVCNRQFSVRTPITISKPSNGCPMADVSCLCLVCNNNFVCVWHASPAYCLQRLLQKARRTSLVSFRMNCPGETVACGRVGPSSKQPLNLRHCPLGSTGSPIFLVSGTGIQAGMLIPPPRSAPRWVVPYHVGPSPWRRQKQVLETAFY